MSCEVTFMPIGHVRGGRKEATKDGWGNNRSRIELDGENSNPMRFSASRNSPISK